MSQAFVIMRIGNKELDKIYDEALIPSIKSCGLEPKRVDKHNKGGLLKSEIIQFIHESPIIIADLTDERPNCYLEVGYAMGINKFKNLILTARQDHNIDSPHHVQGGPKVHFDLGGYEILFWDPSNLKEFTSALERRIHRRLELLDTTDDYDQDAFEVQLGWLRENGQTAIEGLKRQSLQSYFEAYAIPINRSLLNDQKTLLSAARKSSIPTFGFSLIEVLTGEFKPSPRRDGILAEIPHTVTGNHYNYWNVNIFGCLFVFEGLFEEGRGELDYISFNTRIIRISEFLLTTQFLLNNLGFDADTVVRMGIKHSGLMGKKIGSVNRLVRHQGISKEDESVTQLDVRLGDINDNTLDIVKTFTEPLFILFDFFELADPIYSDIIEAFKNGRCI